MMFELGPLFRSLNLIKLNVKKTYLFALYHDFYLKFVTRPVSFILNIIWNKFWMMFNINETGIVPI